MQATNIPLPSSLKLLKSPSCRRPQQPVGGRIVRARTASPGGGDSGGKLVDENMILLRMRISEMKSREEGHQKSPSDWTEWEKQYAMGYDELVFQAMGILQNYLMNVRPCLAIGLVVLVALCLGISSWVVLVHALNMSREILCRFHIIT